MRNYFLLPVLFFTAFLAFSPASASPALTITSNQPTGEVQNLTQITVRFSENMRPLGQMEQDAATSPLQLKTAAGDLPSGNYRWMDPATLAYLLDEPVTAPLKIIATVPGGTRALSGNTLEKTVSWEISTPPYRFSVSPTAHLSPKNPVVTLYSNYELQPGVLKDKLAVTLNGNPVPFTVDEPKNHAAPSFRGRPISFYYRINITADLPPDATVDIRLAPGLTFRKGGEAAKAHHFAITGYSTLKLLDWHAPEISGKGTRMPPESTVTASFNNPVKLSDLLDHLDISPKAARITPDDDNRYASKEDTLAPNHSLPFRWEARTKYTIRLKPGLKDTYGTTLKEGSAFSFTTGDFHPLFQMETGNKVMEKNLGGKFPINVRNLSPIRVKLRYHPWSRQVYNVWPNNMQGDELLKLPAAVEKTITLDFSRDFNKNIHHELDLPALLGMPINDMNGLTEIFVTATDKEHKDRAGKYLTRTYYATAILTNTAIMAKMGQHNGLVWITDMHTGKPLENVNYHLIDRQGNVLYRDVTGSDGTGTLPGRKQFRNPVHYVVAENGNDVSVLSVDDSAGDTILSNYNSAENGKFWAFHPVTQLPLYQPGQTVNYSIYLKDFRIKEDGKLMETPGWRPIAGEKIRVVIRDNRGRDVDTFETASNEYGSVSGSYTINEEASVGNYTFLLTRLDKNLSMTRPGFKVAAFRAPDFKVDIEPFRDQPNPPERAKPIPIFVSAAYFSGVPLPGAAAGLTVTRQDEHFTPERLAGYRTGIAPDNPWRYYRSPYSHYNPVQTVAELLQVMDENGRTMFFLPDIIAAPGKPVRVGMQVNVTDESGLTSQGENNFLLHPSGHYIGIRAQRIMLVNQEQTIDLKAASWDNQPLTDQEVTLKAERKKKNTGSDDENDTELQWEKNITLAGEEGISLPVRFEKSGTYLITASIRDEMGRENITRSTIIVPGPDLDWISTRTDQSLELLCDDITYNPGDTARIIIRNPFYIPGKDNEKSRALVTIERDSIREHYFVDISGASYPLEISLAKQDAPYLYVSIVMQKGRTAPPPTVNAADNRDMGAPWVRRGTALLKINTEEPELVVDIKTDAKEYRPGGKVHATIRVSDTAKQARQVQLTLLAVDNRILRAAGEKTNYDPKNAFEPIYLYGINTNDSRIYLLNLSQISPRILGGMAQARHMEAAAPMPSMAMQDAKYQNDENAPAKGNNDSTTSLRQNFSPLAHWLASGETDASGMLETTFTLPDTLTSYRIVVIAADKTKEFGIKETNITATKPLQLLSALPRFVTEGDRLDLRILAQNAGKTKEEITVTAKADNMKLATTAQKITLEPGKSGTATFPATILAPGKARITIYGKMREETDAAEFSIPVMPAAPLTTVAAAGLLKEGKTHTVPVKPPAQLDPRSKMAVVFAASPAAGLPLTAEQIIHYPWGCLEQRMSRAWVRAIRLRHGNMIGLPPDDNDRKIIQDTFNRAEKFQKYDGGFTLWENMRTESSFYLTTYVMVVDNYARPLGLSLPEDVKRKAANYLVMKLREQYNNREKQKQAGKNTLDSEALALWVLSQQQQYQSFAGQIFPLILKRASEEKNVTPMTWAALLMLGKTLPNQSGQDQTTETILRNLEKNAQVTPTHLHFAASQNNGYWMTMGSTLRDNGLILGALADTRPSYPRLEALAAWTSQTLGDRKTLSTQEAIWGLWGLTTYLQTLGGNQPVSLTATWNNKESMTKKFTRLIDPPQTWTLPADKLISGKPSSLTFKANKGNPYWTARLTYASPLLPVRDENAGFTIKRSWAKQGDKHRSKPTWQMGDIINVTVTISVPATRRHVLLFDPFPAGLEPLFASRIDLDEKSGHYQPPWQFQETHNDGMLLYAENVFPGVYTYTYKLRAAAPGTFTQRPTYVEEMYTPEVFGRTAGDTVTITTEK